MADHWWGINRNPKCSISINHTYRIYLTKWFIPSLGFDLGIDEISLAYRSIAGYNLSKYNAEILVQDLLNGTCKIPCDSSGILGILVFCHECSHSENIAGQC